MRSESMVAITASEREREKDRESERESEIERVARDFLSAQLRKKKCNQELERRRKKRADHPQVGCSHAPLLFSGIYSQI
jgi:hypothetical protein